MAPPHKIDQRYEIEKNLGGGLSGEVMLVKDPEGNRAALKFLKKVQMNVSRQEALQNFKNEFEILKQLNHPNISRILDFGFDSRIQKYYFTCEFISGAEMHDACKEANFETIEKLIVQVLRALNYLHSRGIYHFDIKPQNILVHMEEGIPKVAKIIDFGLAGFSSPRKKVGTPAFMAPEVIQGGLLDGRTDLYSTGVLIYQLLTGKNPFSQKKLRETLEKHIKYTPPPPSQINPEVPKYWDHIVSRMLEKDPVNRYSQASLVIRDLNFLSNKKFDIETKDTKLSYLPEKGTLIGREIEWKTFTDMFEDIFLSDEKGDDNILIIEGPKGSGKSRLLSEAKYYAQLRNISVKNVSQFQEEDSDHPFILLLDSEYTDADRVNALLQEISYEQHMVIWATEKAPKNWRNSKVVSLKNYSQAQLKQYIESVTGLSSAPDQLIEEVYHRTLGNPLFVTEFIKSLLDEGLLFDDSGQWDAKTFEDIKIDFNKIHIPNSVEDHLSSRFQKLSKEKQEILQWMAMNNQPLSIDQMLNFTNQDDLRATILDLINDDIIEKTTREHTYFFKNLLFTEVIQKRIDPKNKSSFHNQLKDLYRDNPEEKTFFLFHEGRGSDIELAKKALFELGCIQLNDAKEEKSIENFSLLLNITDDPFGSLEIKAQFKLGRAYLNKKHFDKAISTYSAVAKHFSKAKDTQDHNTFLRAYNHLTDTFIKREDYETAQKHCQLAQNYLKEQFNDPAYEMIFENHHAHILLKQGDVESAEKIYLRTQKAWEEELESHQREKVDNNRLLEIYLLRQADTDTISLCEANIKSLKKQNNKFSLALQHYALGDVYYRMTHAPDAQVAKEAFDKSVRNFETCEKIARDIHDYGLMLRAFNGLGNIYSQAKDWKKCLNYYKRALAVSRKQEEYWNAAIISYNIGGIHLHQKEYKDSYSYLVYTINTLENASTTYSPHTEINLFLSYMQIAEIYLHNNDILTALESMDKADEYFESTEVLKVYEFWRLIRRARIHFAEGESEKANTFLEKAKVLAKDKEEIEELEETIRLYGKPQKKPHSSDETKGVKIMTNQNNSTAGADDLKKIIEINKFINSEYDPQQLLKVVLNYAIQLSNAEAGFVLLLDEEGSFAVKASMNTSESDQEKISMSIARCAIEKGEIITSSDALSDDRFDSSESIVLNELKSVLCLPIRSKNKSIGVFYLDNRYQTSAFETCNVNLLTAFCDQVGIALENTKLISQLMDAQDQLQNKLEKTTEELAQVKDILKNESESYQTKYAYNAIISRSEPMQTIFKLLDKVTETNLSVFIHGQSGTGKELVAKALHYNNPTRNGQRFIAINCGAIPANLMESELFGHKKGSFTGADKDKKGLFEEANGGTLFLDEIGELDPQLQVKLLRVLQEGEVQSIGESQPLKIDVRVVCASHKDLENLVKDSTFREDLFYRLCQMKIDLPPLKERSEDIPLLAKHFIEKFKKQNNFEDDIEIPPIFMKALLEYDWPGNVRELENLISVACALRDGHQLCIDNLPPNYGVKKLAEANSLNANLAHQSSAQMSQVKIDEENTFDPTKTWQNYESVILAKAYQLNGKKKMPTADCLGVSHSTIYKKISDMELDEASNPLYADDFVYNKDVTLKEYVVKIFSAALKYHNEHPYAAIKQLGISQGYFYKIMKQFKEKDTDTTTAAAS